MTNDWHNAIKLAGANARQQFNRQTQDLVHDDLADLLPSGIDVEKLEAMRTVVRDARLTNKEKAKQLSAMADFNEVVVALLDRVFK